MYWAWEYSTASANCGFRTSPQPSPGYVQLCCVSMGRDGTLSMVTSWTDWGSCGWGSTMLIAT